MNVNIKQLEGLIGELNYYLKDLHNHSDGNNEVYEDYYKEINLVIEEIEKITGEILSRYILEPVYDDQLGDFFPVDMAMCRSSINRLTTRLKTQFINSRQKGELDTPSALYIKENIAERFKDKKDGFSYKKLIGLINELNKNYIMSNPYACLALIRAIEDHIPPLLGFNTFEEVVNNYVGKKTDKAYLVSLLKDRPVSDDTLHRRISKSEDLIDMDNVPNKQFLNRLLQECLDNSVKEGFQHEIGIKKEKKSRVVDPNVRPVLQAAITSLSGSSQGYVVNFDIKNAGKGLAIIKDVVLGDVIVLIKEATLGESEQAKASINIEGSELRKGNIKFPKLEIKYENIYKDKFQTNYEIKLESRADGLFNIVSFTSPDFGD